MSETLDFVPTGLLPLEQIKAKLGDAEKKFTQTYKELMDSLTEDMPINALNIACQNSAWEAYYEAAMQMMRTGIALANTQRREKNARI